LVMGVKLKGIKFILKSFLTITILGLLIDLFAFLNPLTDQPILACLYGGIFQGIGIGLFVKYEFSSGGTELLGRIFARLFRISSVPICIALCDALIVISGAVAVHKAENMLYALIVIFVSAKVSELIMMGLDKSKLCFIITKKGMIISEKLTTSSPRGVTLLKGMGMYTHEGYDVLMTCIKNRQIQQLKQIVKSIDNDVFIIINDSVEVRGNGFSPFDEDKATKK